MLRQSDLAQEAQMHQSRISMFETPGAANLTLDTLSRLAAAFRVGLKVEFVPFSDMLRWENGYSQDSFSVTKLEDDVEFLQPARAVHVPRRLKRNRRSRPRTDADRIYQIPIASGLANPFSLHQERTQMRLRFEPFEQFGPQIPQSQLANLITFPHRSSYVFNPPITKAAMGAERNYGNR